MFPKLSQPAQRALANAGIKTMEDLAQLTEKQFAGLHGIGPGSVKVIKEAMKVQGLSFKNQ